MIKPSAGCNAILFSGHGTHVAGIVAGKAEVNTLCLQGVGNTHSLTHSFSCYSSSRQNFTGVAPDATLGVWRIFGCSGGTSDDIIVQALLEAEKAGCDIINLSIGDMNGWSETVTSVVASSIAKRGIHGKVKIFVLFICNGVNPSCLLF